ncbi:MAG: NUDIX domain-containing protein [Chloroflexi bacterium]|nr:NUDIX domain-containing protein [Chloroflexota bacterium]
MITFDRDGARFNYRVAGVALHGDRVLAQQAEGYPFWFLPGGRGELLESARDTLRREMQEELGTTVQVERLLWVVENFFELDSRSYHELSLYFLITFPADSYLYQGDGPFASDEAGIRCVSGWHPISALETLDLRPAFLRKTLKAIPEHAEHIMHVDERR